MPSRTKYNANNWLKEGTSNMALNMIHAIGGAIAMNQDGALMFRLSEDDSLIPSKDYRAVSEVFSNFLDMRVDFINPPKKGSDELEDDSFYVSSQDLKMVRGTRFDPHANEEFIETKNGLFDLNYYRPTEFMESECNESHHCYKTRISAIMALVMHLSNYDQERAYWLVNWLAFFFQDLKKAQVALILRGAQGAGKEIFFKEIIQALLGEAYAKTINDKSLGSSYLGGLVENTLFFNLDEISVKKSKNSSIKNFLKALVTNETITAEKKFKTLDKATKIYGQVLITTNEDYPVEIELGDRRFSVFTTGGALKDCGFLGYGGYEALSDAIEEELESFICYLKSFPVDAQKANTPLHTPEKEQLIRLYQQQAQLAHNKTHGQLQPKLTRLEQKIQLYAQAIRYKQLWIFEPLRLEQLELHWMMMSDFNNNIFRIDNLLPTFKALYGVSQIKTTAELLRELQRFDMYQFGMANVLQMSINQESYECLRIHVGY